VSERLKKRFLELLEKDVEFRYTVAGYIGLHEILKRLDEHGKAIIGLQEAVKGLQEAVKNLQEFVKTLNTRVVALEDKITGLDTKVTTLDARVTGLDTKVTTLENKVMELDVKVTTLDTRVTALDGKVSILDVKVSAIGVRYGVVTEEAFRASVKYLIEDLLKLYKVERWTYYDSEGLVYGYPSTVEVDVLIKDMEHVLVEYKAHADRQDVSELSRIGRLYEKVVGVKPRLLLVAPMVRERARDLAKELEVELRGVVYY